MRMGAGSGLRMSHTEMAEQTKDAASNSMAMGAVINCTRMPAIPGPAICAIDSVKASRLFPVRMFSRAMSEGRYAW